MGYELESFVEQLLRLDRSLPQGELSVWFCTSHSSGFKPPQSYCNSAPAAVRHVLWFLPRNKLACFQGGQEVKEITSMKQQVSQHDLDAEAWQG